MLSFEGLEDVQLEPTPSEPPGLNGKQDVCHIDIVHEDILSDEFKEKCTLFSEAYCKPPFIFICKNGNSYQISKEEYKNLVAWIGNSYELPKK